MIMHPTLVQSDKMPVYVSAVEHQDNETLGERRLLNAILIRAIQDATGNVSCPYCNVRLEQERALHWIMDESEELWSFRWVCSVILMSHTRIRQKIDNALMTGVKIFILGGRQPSMYSKAC